jgi:hypothetical protein
MKYSRGGPLCRDFIRRYKETVQNSLARSQTAGAGLKRQEAKPNRTKKEVLHKEEKLKQMLHDRFRIIHWYGHVKETIPHSQTKFMYAFWE